MKQPLYMVIGGELEDLSSTEFRNKDNIHIVGVFDYETAQKRWRGAAQQTVDNALMRYFIVPTGLAA